MSGLFLVCINFHILRSCWRFGGGLDGRAWLKWEWKWKWAVWGLLCVRMGGWEWYVVLVTVCVYVYENRSRSDSCRGGGEGLEIGGLWVTG